MKNLKNEGSSPLILSRTTRKPLETHQIPLGSPCEVNRYPKASLDNRYPKATLSTESDLQREIAGSKAREGIGGFEHSSESGQLGLPLTNEGGEV